MIAPDAETTTRVLANFQQVIKQGDLRLHPMITRLVDEDTLKKMSAQTRAGADTAEPEST